ncbi:MAG: synthase protein [Methylobacteriaceae bacterium]|nr:synthase protein [Methylobacteriaceae bacterium]
MANNGGGESESELRARLNTLSAGIEAQRHKPAAGGAPESAESAASARGWGRAMSLGVRVVTELVAGIVVGGGIGWLLDRWLGTKPLLLILFGLLGTAGGFWNVVRATSRPLSGPPPG